MLDKRFQESKTNICAIKEKENAGKRGGWERSKEMCAIEIVQKERGTTSSKNSHYFNINVVVE